MSDEPRSTDRLDSWKDIAAYLKRDVSTVQRYEKREGMLMCPSPPGRPIGRASSRDRQGQRRDR